MIFELENWLEPLLFSYSHAAQLKCRQSLAVKIPFSLSHGAWTFNHENIDFVNSVYNSDRYP